MKLFKYIIILFSFSTLFILNNASAKDLKIAFFASSSENGYNQAIWEGVKAAATEAGAETAIYNGEFNGTLQYSQIEDVVTSGEFDGLVICPNDTVGVAGALEQAIAAGMKVGTALFPIGPDLETLEPQVEGLTATAAGSPTAGATMQAEGVVEFCKDKDPCNVIIIIGLKIYPFDKLRYDVFLDVLGQHSNIKIGSTVEGNYSPDISLTGMTDALQATKNVHAILSNADQHLIGAEIALADAGYNVPDLYLMGGGASAIAIEAIKEGRWDATYAYFPFTEGYEAAKAVIGAIQGKEVNAVFDMNKVGAVNPIVTKEVLDANPGWEAEWEG